MPAVWQMDLHLYKENCLALVICYVVGLLNLSFATLWQFSCSHTISYGSVAKDRSFFWDVMLWHWVSSSWCYLCTMILQNVGNYLSTGSITSCKTQIFILHLVYLTWRYSRILTVFASWLDVFGMLSLLHKFSYVVICCKNEHFKHIKMHFLFIRFKWQ